MTELARPWGREPDCLTASSSLDGVVGQTRFSAGSLSLEEVAQELDRETLRRLKRECGGLQTLLRNSHQVFEGKGTEPANALVSQVGGRAPPSLSQNVLLHRLPSLPPLLL